MISKKVLSLLLGTMLAATTMATINTDNDQTHGHPKEYFENLKSTYQNQTLYVHLIPHTHDDVGWLKTVDMYYSGSNNFIQQAEVHLILDSTIQQLLNDPNKRFTYVEMKFFSMWWSEQDETLKAAVRGLVKQGRLEFVNAGWSMHDEACTHYEDMINNMQIGHEFLMQEFQVRPRIGWHIDPFGHSNGNPRLFAEMGFDAWFFARIDAQDKVNRLSNKSMQWVWRPFFDHLGKSVQIFTGTMQDHYCWPQNFSDGDDPVVDDKQYDTFNADEKIADMMNYVIHMQDHYLGNHLLIPMGCDFAYANAAQNFDSMDKLIKYFNDRVPNITLMYSTPGMYLDALIAQNLTWPTKYDDMFPYGDDRTEYWTGFFTSRPNSKKQVRDGSANIHASGKLYALQVIDQQNNDTVINETLTAKASMMDAMGVYQHHDAITGTAKQYVANNYANRLYNSMEANNAVQTKIIDEIMRVHGGQTSDSWSWCNTMNATTYLDCPIANNTQSTHIVAVHNPSLLDVSDIRLKVPHGNYNVFAWNTTDDSMDAVDAAVFCINKVIANGTLINDCEMHVNTVVPATHLQYLVVQYNDTVDVTVKPSTQLSMSNSYETLLYIEPSEEGAIFELTKYNLTHLIAFDIRYYESYQCDPAIPDGCEFDSDGAYLMIINVTQSTSYSKIESVQAYNGAFSSEIHIFFNDEATNQSAVVRVRQLQSAPVTTWDVTLYGVPYSLMGKEITCNWRSFDIQNNNTFYTDSNALEMQQRVTNYRPSWNFVPNVTITSNFYPINSAIAVVDTKQNYQMTVMNDRSQAGSVVENGRIELLHHRRLYYDDNRGVNEALNETDIYGNGITVPATYHLHFFDTTEETSVQRKVQLLTDEPLQYFFAFNWTKVNNTESTPIKQMKLDSFVSMNTSVPFKYQMFPVKKNQIFVRFENIADKFDSMQDYNQTLNTIYVKVNDFAEQLYAQANPQNPTLNSINIVETSITGNQPYDQMKASKVQWMGVDDANITEPAYPQDRPDFEVALQPQRIRSFNIEFVPAVSSSGIIQ